MRRVNRVTLAAALFALGLSLTGCESFDPDKFTDWLGTAKKPLPGERKPVFPEGVPGVQQGVPPELIKGNQPPPDANPPAVVVAPPEQEPEEKPAEKPKPKPKAKKTVQRAQPTQETQPAQQQPQSAPWPAQPAQPQSPQTAWPPVSR
jgi:outer membrane biosynthesis protein TonB